MSDTPRHPDEDDDATVRLPRPDRSAPSEKSPVGSPAFDTAGSGSSAAEGGATGGSSVGDTAADSSVGGDSAAGGPARVGGGPAAGASVGGGPAVGSSTGASAAGGGARGVRSVVGGLGAGWRRLADSGSSAGAPGGRRPRSAAGTPEERQRRRRQWWVAGISAGAAVVVIALCAGLLWVVDLVDGDDQDSTAAAGGSRALRDQSCLELERRLNRLVPPGATAGPAARAVAVRDENAAVRIYLGELRDERAQDGWRRLLDARAVFADALDRQSKSRTPAFYVAPRDADGEHVTAGLLEWSATPCGGPLRRLAAPDL